MKKFETILFDLDGTLIDQFGAIFRCYEHTFKKLGLPPLSYEEVKGYVGGSLDATIRELVGDDLYPAAIGLYREHFEKIRLEDLHVFPGVEWLLPELKSKGFQLAIFTNKHGGNARAICEHLAFSDHVERVFGALDTPYHKPDPEFSKYALNELGARAETTCLVGDSPWDIGAAKNVGMKAYCVTTGTHNRSELAEAGADAIFDDFFELGEDGFGLTPGPAQIQNK